MSEFVTCPICRDGSCTKCEGDGGWEENGKWVTCSVCNGLTTCQACFGQVTTINPYIGAILPILPNPQDSWETLLFPLL